MPKYNFACPSCGPVIRLLKPAEAKQKQTCPTCSAPLKRDARPPTSQTMERLDNGFMTKPVERLKEAPRLFHEYAKGKKTAI